MDVVVPRYPPPRFPNRCVVCGLADPHDTAHLLAQAPSRGRFIFDSYSVEVPCCRGCGAFLHVTRIGRTLLMYAIWAGAVALVLWRDVSRLAAVAIIGTAVLGVGVVNAFRNRWFPPCFDLEAASNSVTFTFRDLSLGYEFRALNPAAREAGRLTSA